MLLTIWDLAQNLYQTNTKRFQEENTFGKSPLTQQAIVSSSPIKKINLPLGGRYYFFKFTVVQLFYSEQTHWGWCHKAIRLVHTGAGIFLCYANSKWREGQVTELCFVILGVQEPSGQTSITLGYYTGLYWPLILQLSPTEYSSWIRPLSFASAACLCHSYQPNRSFQWFMYSSVYYSNKLFLGPILTILM